MPLYMIERNFAEELEMTKDTAAAIQQVATDMDSKWLLSFLAADKKKTYCVFEAPNAEAAREHARRLDLPADLVVEVGEIRPEMFV